MKFIKSEIKDIYNVIKAAIMKNLTSGNILCRTRQERNLTLSYL